MLVLLVWAAGACQPAAPTVEPQPAGSFSSSALDGARYVWVEAECADGPLDLARLGFERELTLDVRGVSLLMTFDSELIVEGCYQTMVWRAEPALESDAWQVVPEAHVELPLGVECGAREREPMGASLRFTEDLLELVTYDSPWCRGFDARFVYRRAPPRRPTERQLVARYVAHFDRRDAQELSLLFAENASLVEPFSPSQDGNHVRHEGREAIRAYFERAFASTRWLAMRLSALSPVDESGSLIADWQYMDDHLAEPLLGRNLFLIAAGEIYETELQLVSDPVAGEPPPDAPASDLASEGTAPAGEARADAAEAVGTEGSSAPEVSPAPPPSP